MPEFSSPRVVRGVRREREGKEKKERRQGVPLSASVAERDFALAARRESDACQRVRAKEGRRAGNSNGERAIY